MQDDSKSGWEKFFGIVKRTFASMGISTVISLITDELSWWDAAVLGFDLVATLTVTILSSGAALAIKIINFLKTFVGFVDSIVQIIGKCSNVS